MSFLWLRLTHIFGEDTTVLENLNSYIPMLNRVNSIESVSRNGNGLEPTDQYFNIYYEIVDDENEGEWLTAAEIFDFLKKTVGSSLKVNSLMGFGRRLANMPEI